MKIFVCCKIVPAEHSIKVNADRTLDFSNAEYEVSQYDLNAIEAAGRLAAQAEDATLTAVTVGGDYAAAPKMKKSILSRGPAELYAVSGREFDGCDALTTAKLLKGALEKAGGFDLVICGEGSGDMYNQQTGCMLGALCGVNTLNSVSALRFEDGQLIAERSIEDGVEVLAVDLPAVINVSSDIALPRIPSMKEILGAGKKPCNAWGSAELTVPESTSQVLSILSPEQTERKKIIFADASEDSLNELCEVLKKLM